MGGKNRGGVQMRGLIALLFFAGSLTAQTGQLSIKGGVIDFSGAPHTITTKVVSSVPSLPSTGCTPGELAVVTGATLGQQIYQNSGSGACVWTQQISGTPGGTNGQVQYNNSGAFGGLSGTFIPMLTSGVAAAAVSANVIGLWSGTCNASTVLGGNGVCNAVSSGFDAITSATNTTAAMVVGTGASLTVSGSGTINATSLGSVAAANYARLDTANTFTAQQITSLNGAASTPPFTLTGTIFTGGSATTTKCASMIEPTGTTSTGWSTAGCLYGGNAPSGFTGNLLDLQLNGSGRVRVTAGGDIAGALSLTRDSGDLWLTATTSNIVARPGGDTTATFRGTGVKTIALGRVNSATTGTVDITDGLGSTGATRVNIGLGAADSAGTTTLTNNGSTTSFLYKTLTNCADAAGAAACGSASAGAFVVDAAGTSTVVSTTAVTATSRILVFFDSGLSTELGITCNTTVPALYGVTARTAATSFTLTSSAPVTNPACFSYVIVN